MDSVPVGLFKRAHFEPGTAHLGNLIFPDGDSTDICEKFSEKSTQVDTRKLNSTETAFIIVIISRPLCSST
jgi:hypothetical protein